MWRTEANAIPDGEGRFPALCVWHLLLCFHEAAESFWIYYTHRSELSSDLTVVRSSLTVTHIAANRANRAL